MNRRPLPLILPLDYVSELGIELHLMRGECVELARELVTRRPLDERRLQDCAELEEAVAKAQRVLQGAVERIALRLRAKG